MNDKYVFEHEKYMMLWNKIAYSLYTASESNQTLDEFMQNQLEELIDKYDWDEPVIDGHNYACEYDKQHNNIGRAGNCKNCPLMMKYKCNDDKSLFSKMMKAYENNDFTKASRYAVEFRDVDIKENIEMR